MSPTTLYREGTDLDELLAELDTQYPGQVQVLEITHPREGGVLGFFAKQRVGVHYRLAEAASGASALAGDAFVAALSAARTRSIDDDVLVTAAAPARGGHDDEGFAAARTRAFDDDAFTAASARGGYDDDGFAAARTAPRARMLDDAQAEAAARAGHGDAFVAALTAARRSAASAAAASAGAVPLARSAVGPAVGTGELGVTEVPPQVATAAAAIAETVAAESRSVSAARAVADDAVVAARSARPALGPDRETLAAALAGRAAQDGSDDALARLGRAVESAARGPETDPFAAMLASIALRKPTASAAHEAAAAPAAREAAPAAVPSRAAARAAALYEQPAPQPITAQPPAYAPADLTGTDFAAAGFEVASPAVPDIAEADEAPLMTWATVDRSELTPAHGTPVSETPQASRPAADEAVNTRPRATAAKATAQATGTERRTDSLPWPIAQAAAVPEAAPTPKITLRRAARNAAAAKPADTAEAPEAAPGRTLVLPRQARALTDDELTAPRSNAQHATPLALRRQLLEIGVPVDLVPADAVHTYAAIEQLVHAQPEAPAAPALPGEILVLVGASRDVVAAADGLLTGSMLAFETIWTFGCPAAVGTRRIPTNGATVLRNAGQAGEVAQAARAERTGAVLIVIGTDSATGRDSTAELIAAISPDAVWGAVEATRKPADIRRTLAPAGRIDGIVVTGAERTASPATVWETGLPIATVDGRPSTPQVWAVLLLDKLSELAQGEDAPCSGALC